MISAGGSNLIMILAKYSFVKQFCFPNYSKRTGQTKTFKSELQVEATHKKIMTEAISMKKILTEANFLPDD